MYKLIALDMDGTLLTNNKEITVRNRQAIAKAQSMGVTIVLASGRPLQGMKPIADSLNITSSNDYIVCYNGSLVYRASDNQVVRKHIMTGKDAKRIASLARELNVHHHAFSINKGLITPKNNPFTGREASVNGVKINEYDFNLLEDDEGIIKTMFADAEEVIDDIILKVPKAYFEDFTLVRSAPIFYEFLDKKSNKGLAVENVANRLGIKANEVICMGDAQNDHHMIEYAGLGVAMGNATEDTKAIADYVTDSNNESGVAKVIEEFILR